MFVHGEDIQRKAFALFAQGLGDGEVAARLGLPRTTVRDWRRPRYVRRSAISRCDMCGRPARPVRLDAPDYAELLGLYLGDGCIATLPRTQRLRLFLDARYPTIVAETEALLRRVFPANCVGRLSRHAGSMVVLWVYHAHLSCLFPQHGAGKKHDRPIVLEPWQEAQVADAPWAFLKGCIRSDGCVYVNRTGRYEYLSYDFANRSPHIRELFARVCASVGVECRPAGERIKVYRRASVALKREHGGNKT